MLFGDIKRAVAADTDVILFNIDSKADHRTGRDADPARLPQGPERIAGLQRRPPAHRPHGALPRRQGQARGVPRRLPRSTPAGLGSRSGTPTSSTGTRSSRRSARRSARARTSAEKWIDGAEDNFSLTVENFCKWVKEYLDSKGPQHRLVFLVDEVGQFIGTDSHLMLNLQTITEELGTICRRPGLGRRHLAGGHGRRAGRHEARPRSNDFSKIQGRF